MKEQLKIPKTFRIITLILISIGALTFLFGILSDSLRTWANYLIVNYYFLSLSLGAAFSGYSEYLPVRMVRCI